MSNADAMDDPCAFSSAPRTQRAQARFCAALFPRGSTVIDIGFGQGYFLEAARGAGCRAVGLDRDPQLVERARTRGLEAHHGDVTDVGRLLAEPVDAFLAQHLVEHLTPREAGRLLSDTADVVRPGGTGVLVTPNFRDWRVASDWFWHDPTHVRPYTSGTVQSLVEPLPWRLVDEGLMPETIDRHTPGVWLQRVRHGRQYGRSGRWFRLERTAATS